MLGSTFYHQTIRKYVAAFGTLFNDLNVERKNSSGNVVERVKVPLGYGPKHQFRYLPQKNIQKKNIL